MIGIDNRVPQEIAGRVHDTEPKFPQTGFTKPE